MEGTVNELAKFVIYLADDRKTRMIKSEHISASTRDFSHFRAIMAHGTGTQINRLARAFTLVWVKMKTRHDQYLDV